MRGRQAALVSVELEARARAVGHIGVCCWASEFEVPIRHGVEMEKKQ